MLSLSLFVLFFGMCTVDLNWHLHLNNVAHKQAVNNWQLFQHSISEGTGYTAPFIAHMCEMGIQNWGGKKNQIAFRNTDHFLAGKSIRDKQEHKNKQQIQNPLN